MRRHPSQLGSLSDGTVFYAPLGEMLRDGDERVCCHLCGHWMKAVGGTHLRSHGWTIDDYREAFQLRRQMPTCATAVSDSLRRAARRRLGQGDFGKPPPRPAVTRMPPPGWRSLARVRPELVTELHPTTNGSLDPHDVAAGSHSKLWWRCSRCDHEWEATVSNRVARDSGCPRCATARRAAARGQVPPQHSLAVRRPGLTNELHPTLNDDLDPYALGASSMRRIWWRCPDCGHEWEATVATRARGTGCPSCWRDRRSRAG